MIHLYKSLMFRTVKNLYYWIGCLIALVVTAAVSMGIIELSSFPGLKTAADRMFFVSAAMVLYFTVFTPLFLNAEYTDGYIRNRIIAGYSQRQIFTGYVLSQMSAAVLMYVLYLIGGLIGGAGFDGNVICALLVMLFALLAYTAVVSAIAFRCRNTVVLMVISIMLFNMCFNCVMFGNAIMMLMSDSPAVKVGAICYNINVLGQWFCLTGLADDYVNPGAAVQILLSLAVTAAVYIFANLGLSKRDLQ